MNPVDVSTSLPLTTRIINRAGEAAQKNVVPSQTDPALVTPEEVNAAVDRADQRVDQVGETQAARREDTRSAIVQINGQQQQQDQVDLYLSIVTEESVDSSGGNVGALSDLNQTLRRGETAQAIADSELTGPRERQQQTLLERIGEAVDDRPSIQPIVDTSV
ncbi:MAG: hypothetical protein ACRBBW_17880 [Cellvibrionaceae bacterium]